MKLKLLGLAWFGNWSWDRVGSWGTCPLPSGQAPESRITLILANSSRNFFNSGTYFRGLSNCPNLVEEMMHSDYKNFDKEVLNQEFCTNLFLETMHDYTSFEKNVLAVLNKHASSKKKVLCANHVLCVTSIKENNYGMVTFRKTTVKKKMTTEFLKKYIKTYTKTIKKATLTRTKSF